MNVSHWVLPWAFFQMCYRWMLSQPTSLVLGTPSPLTWCFPEGPSTRKSHYGIMCFNSSLQLRLNLILCFLVWILCFYFNCIVFYSSREMGLPSGLEHLNVLSFGLEMILLDQLVKLVVGSVDSGGCFSLSKGNGSLKESPMRRVTCSTRKTAPREESSSTPWVAYIWLHGAPLGPLDIWFLVFFLLTRACTAPEPIGASRLEDPFPWWTWSPTLHFLHSS